MNECSMQAIATPMSPPPPPRSWSASEGLYQRHSKLISRVARSVYARTSTSIPVEDLVQIGVMALIKAAEVFEDRGVAQFATYAAVRIRGAMIDELRRSATISRQALRNRREFASARVRLAQILCRQPSEPEIAAHLGLAMPEYCAATTAMQNLSYGGLDAAYSDHNSWFADLTPDALECLQQYRLTTDLAEAIRVLPEREGLILQLYYIEEMTLEQISMVMDVSAARVCQIKKVALDKVRKRLCGWH